MNNESSTRNYIPVDRVELERRAKLLEQARREVPVLRARVDGARDELRRLARPSEKIRRA